MNHTWEPLSNLTHCQGLVSQFHQEHLSLTTACSTSRAQLVDAEHQHMWNGNSIIPARATQTMFVDASDLGWGATWNGKSVQGL